VVAVTVIDVSIDRVNGTVLHLFTSRTDEPRAAIVADILVNDALPEEVLGEMDTVTAGAAAVVVGHERLQHERPDLGWLLQEVTIDEPAVERAVRTLLRSVGPGVDADRHRRLRLELDACTAVRDARLDGRRPELSGRLHEHLPPRFRPLTVSEQSADATVEDLQKHIYRRYEDLVTLLLGPDLAQRTAPDQLPERELRATMYGPTLGPGLRLPE
jgi:hypothetical protein